MLKFLLVVSVLSLARSGYTEEQDETQISATRKDLVDDVDQQRSPRIPRDGSKENPVHGPGKRALNQGAAVQGNQGLTQGFSCVNGGKYPDAIKNLRAFLSVASASELAQADAQAKEQFGRSLQELLVMCYATSRCSTCKGEGVMTCEDCLGSGYTMLHNLTPANAKNSMKQHPMDQDLGSRPRVQVCLKCRGRGTDICPQCTGTGIAFIEPTPYERDAYTAYFMKQANECLSHSETSYGDTPREENIPAFFGGETKDRTEYNLREVVEQLWIRDSADRVKSDFYRLTRAEGFFRLALKSDPANLVKSAQDLNQELIRLGIRRKSLEGAFAERMRFKDFKKEE